MTSSQRFALAIAAALVAFGAGCKSGSMSPNPEPPPDTIALPTAGYIATFAGNGLAGFNGDGKASLSSWLYWPVDAYVDQRTGDVYIVDWNNHQIREVAWRTTALRTVAGGERITDQNITALNHPVGISFAGEWTLLI